jgi:hypothetical protein
MVISSCAAALLSISVAAAQTVSQTPTQSPVQGSTQGTTGQTRVGTGTQASSQVTYTGCVMREGNKFVLANAMANASTASAGAATSPGVGQPGSGPTRSTTGTTGTTAPGAASGAGRADDANAQVTDQPRSTPRAAATSYALSGSRQAELAQHVGKRVEIVGMLDSASNATAGAATGAGAGVATTAGAARMPELRMTSFREVSGNCQ